MDKKKLKSLISKDEGLKLDFKQHIDLDTESGKKELAKDICAIANSRGGRGYILIGIEDKTKKVLGIEGKELAEEQIQQIVSSRCEPPIPISYELIDLDGRKVGIITIYDGDQKPYQFRENGAFYIRRGSTTDTLRKQELIASFQESLNFNIELCPMLRSDISSLDVQLIDKYFASLGIEIHDENRIQLMNSASIISLDKESNRYAVTLGGLLVFSDINSIFVPHNMIRIVNRINKSFSEIHMIKGKLLQILDNTEALLYKLLPEGYPVDAVYEAIKNAVLYRDYGIFYKEIEVVIDYNSVSVISPGALIKKAKSENVSTGAQTYFRRNMWIYEKLIAIDDKKRFLQSGRGFSRMKKSFKNYGQVVFVNSMVKDIFKVIFPGVNKFLKNRKI